MARCSTLWSRKREKAAKEGEEEEREKSRDEIPEERRREESKPRDEIPEERRERESDKPKDENLEDECKEEPGEEMMKFRVFQYMANEKMKLSGEDIMTVITVITVDQNSRIWSGEPVKAVEMGGSGKTTPRV